MDLRYEFHNELDQIYGKDEVDSFFCITMEHYLGLNRFKLAMAPDQLIKTEDTKVITDVLIQLKKHRPIQYILGQAEFFGLKFMVDEHVLIPRQETEELVALVIAHGKTLKSDRKRLNILDIGTGSGCIAISLAKNIPYANVYALDVSKDALVVAKENAKRNNAAVEFINANILDEDSWNLNYANSDLDILVSNPPYVRHLEKASMKPNVLENEPGLALFVENDDPLLFYRKITDFATQKLKKGGQLFFEINQYLGAETKQLLHKENFSQITLRKDLNGNDRMLTAEKI
ncbi:peptide chain release factor N(5)-glutamine methyltransferase [Winogradskyella aurantia]|uniref:peptide chain release factor N(5)-glutamine methyltransferase n=1 Tax=Winogradskyella aurantia TaxID=1915063 RepID=UPI002936FB06|nr:peptide chain release factor N(5)-glutamine methyltransferase [Winogradskyella aurantia]